MPIRNRHLVTVLGSRIAIVSALLFVTILFTVAAPNGDYGLAFDGTSDNLRLQQTATMLAPSWVSTKTVSMWIRPMGSYSCTATFPGPGRCDAVFGDAPRWWGISRGVSGPLLLNRIWVWNWDGNSDNIGLEYTVGEWMHVALVHSGGRLRAYKNGALVGDIASGNTMQPPPGAFPVLYIGGLVESSTEYMFEGQIDEVQIWNVARSGAEIRLDMYRSLTGSEAGLAAYYPMSNGAGLTVTDESSNNWDGTIVDGWSGCTCAPPDGDYARWLASGAFTGPFKTLDFDGVDDYVDITADAATVIGATWAGTKSMELWLKPDVAGPVVASAAAGDRVFGGPNWGVGQANIGGQDRLWVWNNDGNEDRLGLTYIPGVWTHLVLNHDGGILTVYQDGQRVGSIASGSTAADGTLTMGGTAAGLWFDGQVDELRLWNAARTLLQVQANLFQTVAFNESGLMAYYRFDQGNANNLANSTPEVVDTTSNGRHGTMVNMVSFGASGDWMLSTAFNTWIGSESSAWSHAANWSRNTAPTTHLGVAQYPGSYSATVLSPSNIGRAVVVPAANLAIADVVNVTENLTGLGTVNVTAGGTLVIPLGSVISVTGSLQNSGTLSQTQLVNGSLTGFFDMGGYGGVRMDPAGQNLGNTTVSIRGNQDCTTEPGETVLRCFDITPQLLPTTGISMTFAFADSELSGNNCDTVNVYHANGSGWEEIIPTSRDCSQPLNFVTVENVSSFSPFVLRSLNSPTAVTLQSFNIVNNQDWLVILPVMLILFATGGLLVWRARREKQLVS